MPGLTIEFVDERWERFDRLLMLDYAVLYRDFGVAEESDWYHGGIPSLHAVALVNGRLLGAARLLDEPGSIERQIRQVAVEPAVWGQGIGRALMEALERRAASEGARLLWLNARESAFPFYASLGYGFDGEMFVSELTRLPHRRMIRELDPPPS